jgi:hypothetical protein
MKEIKEKWINKSVIPHIQSINSPKILRPDTY